jgi:hypothetical protein
MMFAMWWFILIAVITTINAVVYNHFYGVMGTFSFLLVLLC